MTTPPRPLLLIMTQTHQVEVDDLSEVSMASASGIGKQEFQGLLSDIAAQHQRMVASLDTLATRVEDMSVGVSRGYTDHHQGRGNP